MTKILTGITFAVVILAFGMSAQSFAMPMSDKIQDSVPIFPQVLQNTISYQEGIDGIIVPKSTDQSMMLVAESSTSKHGVAVLHLVPKPHEGIDGIVVSVPTIPPSVGSPAKSNTQISAVLANVSTQSSTGLKSTPTYQEGLDGIIIPKSGSTHRYDDGLGIDGIILPKSAHS
jgi:hypothetical protein